MHHVKLSFLSIMVVMIFLFSSCTMATFYPEEGDWYCEELKLQLSFGDSNNCFIIKNGEIIDCACGSDKGSSWLSVGCQENGSIYYELGEEVFGAEFVQLEHDTLIVYDPQANKEYTFINVTGVADNVH